MLAALIGPAAPVAGESLDLDIHKLALDGGEIEFHQTLRDSVLPAEVIHASLSCGSTAGAKVCVDQSHIAPNEFREFDYVFFVFRGSANPMRFKFLATPTGKFVDHLDTLHFDLNVDGASVPGTLRSPVYSNAQMDQLTVANESTFHPVRLDGETPIPLRIQSIAQDLDILLVDQATVRCDPNLWARCEVRFLNLRDLGQGLKALPLSPNLPALEIRVTPLSLKALTASLLPFKRSAAVKGAAERAGEDAECGVHDRLTVSIRYRSRGGLERLLTRELPIRFVPSVWSLLGAASSGALFGSLMPIVFGRRRRKGWLKAAGAAVALGLLVEAIATVVASFDTMVRILGFQVDPLQILPTFVLGALVGLRGFESVEDFKGFFKPKTEKAGAEG